MHPLEGELLGRYRLGPRLGAGGMGEVFRARDEQLHRDVAIKMLPPGRFDDPEARARLMREARAAAALNHPYVCTVYEVAEAGGRQFIAMELVDGQTLSAVIERGPLPLDEVLRYGVQLADALAHAHERGVIHRDFKSANVILTPDRRVKVLDFGLARRADASDWTQTVTRAAPVTAPGTIMGTLAYMSPEQLRGEVSRAPGDVWALGIVLCEMTSGSRPFGGTTEYEAAAAVLSDAPAALPPGVPDGLRHVIARCLEKDPDRRYADGREARAALEGLEAGLGPVVAPARTVPRRVRMQHPLAVGRRHAIWLGVAGVTGLAGLTAWRIVPGRDPVRSVAVLPFANTAADEDLDYLCEGLADTLIAQISSLPGMRVTPFSAVRNLVGRQVDPLEAGRQLGIETVLAGTLTLRGDRLVVTAELLEIATGQQLWGSRYDHDVAELLALQDEIAAAIVDEGLRLRLTGEQRRRFVRHATDDAEAFDLYLQARHFQRRATEDDYLYARELLLRAVSRDRRFALGYAALAGIHAMMVTDGLVRPADAWPQVERYMAEASQHDPDLPEVHGIAHAVAFLRDWDWAAADRARRQLTRLSAGELDPGYLRAMALEHWALGRVEEALRLARRTRELDPVSPELAMLEADYLIHAGQIDAAVILYERSIALEPDNPNPWFGLAEARFLQGRMDEALEARRNAHRVAGDHRLDDVLARARGRDGYLEAHRTWVALQLEALKVRQVSGYVSPLDFARAYAQLGEADAAFEHIAAAFVDRAPGLVFLEVDRAWDAIRGDSRFAAAVQRVGLP
jgi:TolB-like protein/Flp pilus assembly protein TadD